MQLKLSLFVVRDGKHVFAIVRLDSTFSESEAAFYQDQIRVSATNVSLFTAEPVTKESFQRAENELKFRLPGLVARYGEAMGRSMFTAPTDESREFFIREIYEVASAAGWGGAQWKDNIYEISGGFSANQCHQVSFEHPQDTAFWSITAYNGNGFTFNDLASIDIGYSPSCSPNSGRFRIGHSSNYSVLTQI